MGGERARTERRINPTDIVPNYININIEKRQPRATNHLPFAQLIPAVYRASD